MVECLWRGGSMRSSFAALTIVTDDQNARSMHSRSRFVSVRAPSISVVHAERRVESALRDDAPDLVVRIGREDIGLAIDAIPGAG